MLNKKRIAIFVGFICCLFFMTTFAGGTKQNTVIATRLVTFIDGYNNSTISEQTIEVGTDAEVPDDPRHEGFVFAGWYLYDDQDVQVRNFTDIREDLRVIAKYAGDLNNNGIADEDEQRYTVTFRDTFDGRILSTQEILPGMSATAPTVLNRDDRTFVGWSNDYTNVTSDVVVDTVYTLNSDEDDQNTGGNENNDPVVQTFYTVTFVDGDTLEIIDRVQVLEGLTASAPSTEGLRHPKRVFDRWDGDYSNVDSDRTITAIYTDDLNNDGVADYLETHYSVFFVVLPYKGAVHGTLEGTLRYDELVAGVTFSEAGVVVPVAKADEHYHAVWSPVIGDEDVEINGNLVYLVTFIPDTDENDNGIADEDEMKYKLTVNYVSVGSKGNHSLTETPLVTEMIAGTKYNLTRDFEGYTMQENQPVSGVMPEEDVTLTITYLADKDDNHDGVNDDEQAKYTLTVNYVSVGSKGNHSLTEAPVVTEMVAGAEYNVARDFEGYTMQANQPVSGVMPEEDVTLTIAYFADKDDNQDGVNDNEQAKYTLTVNYVSVGSKGSHSLTENPVVTEMVAGTEYNVTRSFVGYTVQANQPVSGVMPEEDVTLTIQYIADYDNNHNGTNDNEETKYTLTVNYVSVGSMGSHSLTEVPVVKEMVAGANYDVTRDFEGYTMQANQPVSGVMPEEDVTLTITYFANQDDNHDGVNDNEQAKYTLTVNYVSVGSMGSHSLTENPVVTEMVAGAEYDVTRDFEGYTVQENQPVSGVMPEEDVTLTITYFADQDDNHDGVNDNEQAKYTLTVNYVSVGSKGNHSLTEAPVVTEMVAGTEYNVTRDFEGYTMQENQPVSGVMPEEDVTLTIIYFADQDDNQDGVNDNHQAKYTLTVRHVSNHGTLLEEITEEYLEGVDFTVYAKDFANYTATQPLVTEKMPASDHVVTFVYEANVSGITAVRNGKTLNFNRYDDEARLRERITVYLVDVEGYRVGEPISDYVTNFDSTLPASEEKEYDLTIRYTYGDQIYTNSDLKYTLAESGARADGYELIYTGSDSYLKYKKDWLIPGWDYISSHWENVNPGYSFLELTEYYSGNVEIMSAQAYYENDYSNGVDLEISQRIRYRWRWSYYHDSVYVVNRVDHQDILKNGNSNLSFVKLTYKLDGTTYTTILKYNNIVGEGSFTTDTTLVVG